MRQPRLEGQIKNQNYKIKQTTPNRLNALDDADELLREYNKSHDEHYLFDEEFRGKYLKAISDVVIDWEDEKFAPDAEWFADGDLEISEIQYARSAFLVRGGLTG